ncbi:MAG: pilus assembly protein N-terminal domain-containing protein, partial [Pirellulaceae bacterium]|nr:pilus assembly protein N-terminal domain-containing protein [Pirellulaceae bacterium]
MKRLASSGGAAPRCYGNGIWLARLGVPALVLAMGGTLLTAADPGRSGTSPVPPSPGKTAVRIRLDDEASDNLRPMAAPRNAATGEAAKDPAVQVSSRRNPSATIRIGDRVSRPAAEAASPASGPANSAESQSEPATVPLAIGLPLPPSWGTGVSTPATATLSTPLPPADRVETLPSREAQPPSRQVPSAALSPRIAGADLPPARISNAVGMEPTRDSARGARPEFGPEPLGSLARQSLASPPISAMTVSLQVPAEPEASGEVANGPFEIIEESGEFTLQVRRSKLLQTKQNVYRTAVVDPQICDVLQFTPREVSIIGRAQGATHVTFWFEGEDQKPLTYLVRVVPDAEEQKRAEVEYQLLEDMLADLFPDSKVRLLVMADKLIVKGQAKDSEEASQILTVVRNQTG